MSQIDFFISYSSKDEEIVKDVIDTLEKGGAKCWYAPRDVSGRYAKAIVNAIGNAKIFLLCLSSNAAVSEHVLNEVEMAYNRNRKNGSNIIIEPLCIETLDMDAPEYDEIMYYVRRIHFISPKDLTSSKSIAQEVLLKNKKLLNIEESRSPKKRTTSNYFTDEKEEARLAAQNKFIRKFDEDVYRKVFDSYENADILDVGCGNGNLIFDRLKDFSGSFRLIGIDRDSQMIEEAKNKYKKENTEFLKCDLSSKTSFVDDLKVVMNQMDIDKFDIIHISMVLLHLKNATSLLRKLRRLLKPGGTMFIKEIDDGLNYAYPDEKNVFDRIYRICEMDETSGNRRTGREIYYDLFRVGFKDISLEKSGFPTIGLKDEEKEEFWDMYFKFIFDDIKWMKEKYPENSDIADEYEWYSENYDDIFESFMEEDFMFSLGFQIYLAKK